MEQIPEDIIFKYNPDTLIFMRKMYNLDKPGQIDEAIDLLDAWVKKQNHFVKKDFSRDYLERQIMLLKGSVERTKGQIEKLCTIKTLLPQYFEKTDVRTDFKISSNHQTSSFLPKLTTEHYRIFIMRFESERFTTKIFSNIYLYNTIICEYLKAHDFSDGLICIIDFRNVSSIMDFVTQLNLTEMRQMLTILLKAYGARIKKIIIIYDSNAIQLMVRILKQTLSEKLGQRIYVVKDVEELHELAPKALLPSDYGGDEKPLATLRDEFQEVLASKENIEFLKEMNKAVTNESLRTSTKINDDILGIAGTFRTLNVD